MHCHVTNRPGKRAYLARPGTQAIAGTTAGADIRAADQSRDAAQIDQCSSALSCVNISLSELFELHIEDWVLFRILIVEVPPLLGVNLEILFFHGLAQKSTASAPTACHRSSRQVHGASAVMRRAHCRISDKDLFVFGGGVPKDFRDVP